MCSFASDNCNAMPKPKLNTPNTLYFRRWSAKGYAVFASLHRQVVISVLMFSYSIISIQAVAQNKGHQVLHETADTLPEVEIGPDDTHFAAFPVQALQQVLMPVGIVVRSSSEAAGYLPGIDIRTRGAFGVQGDIQIRGGSPEQAMVLVNGIPMNDPQTGHHNLNLPIPDICISKIAGYSAGEALLSVPGVYSGAVNFITKTDDGNHISIEAYRGSFALSALGVCLVLGNNKTAHMLAYERAKSNGFSRNTDFEGDKVFYAMQAHVASKSNVFVQAGAAIKKFGAHNFYSNRFPYQYEELHSGFASLMFSRHGLFSVKPYSSMRWNHDRFELFRESFYAESNGFYIWNGDTAKYVAGSYSPANYYSRHNYHQSLSITTQLPFELKTRHGIAKAGLTHSHNAIVSNMLGHPLAEPKFDMLNREIALTHSAANNVWQAYGGFAFRTSPKWRCNAGITALYYKNTVSPGGGVNITYFVKPAIPLWLSVVRSQRMPTFTELYYSSVTNVGNERLKAEDAINYEIGFSVNLDALQLQNRLFFIDGRNTIDWVRSADELVYRAMNHTELQSFGNTIYIMYAPRKTELLHNVISQFAVSHTVIEKTKHSMHLVSAYSLDYLRHKFTANAGFRITKKIQCEIAYTWQQRNGTYSLNNLELFYPAFSNADISLIFDLNQISVSLSSTNVLNNTLIDFGGIALAPRMFSIGFVFHSGISEQSSNQ